MVTLMFSQLLHVELGAFPTMTYHDAFKYYGNDSPDLEKSAKVYTV